MSAFSAETAARQHQRWLAAAAVAGVVAASILLLFVEPRLAPPAPEISLETALPRVNSAAPDPVPPRRTAVVSQGDAAGRDDAGLAAVSALSGRSSTDLDELDTAFGGLLVRDLQGLLEPAANQAETRVRQRAVRALVDGLTELR